MKTVLPLTASVVVNRASTVDERTIWEFEHYYVRSSAPRGWVACRESAMEVPLRLTTGHVAIVQWLTKPPAKTPQDAARDMWAFIHARASGPGVWLVDDDVPEALREGVNLMPLEKAFAVHDAIAMAHAPTRSASEFVSKYRRHVGPGKPPGPGDAVRAVGPRRRRRQP
jgi:hypothetical protein